MGVPQNNYLEGTGGLVIETDVPSLGEEILLLGLAKLHADFGPATTEFLKRIEELETSLSPGNGMGREV